MKFTVTMFRNDLTARSLHKYEGYNICDKCHESIFIHKSYGPAEGMETSEERMRETRLGKSRKAPISMSRSLLPVSMIVCSFSRLEN